VCHEDENECHAGRGCEQSETWNACVRSSSERMEEHVLTESADGWVRRRIESENQRLKAGRHLWRMLL
jgi:hypothetical protein